MPIPSELELCVGLIAMGAVQLWIGLRFALELARQSAAPRPDHSPPATVIIPCKGKGDETNIRSILAQRYPGPLEFLFVTARAEDPARAQLESLLPTVEGVRAKVLVSNARPEKSGEQTLNLLHGAEQADPKSEAFVFCDFDIRVRPDVVAELASPLKDPEVGVTSAPPLYIPISPAPASLLRLLWMAAGISYLPTYPTVAGPCLAMTRREFEEAGMPGIWKRSLLVDGILDRVMKKRGKKRPYVSRATTRTLEVCGLAALLKQFNKWLIYYRTHCWPVWAVFCAGVLAKTAVLIYAALPPFSAKVIVLYAGLEAANAALVVQALRAYLPDRFEGMHPLLRPPALWVALVSPFLLPIYVVNLVSSTLTSTFAWGGYVYRVRGPEDIEVLPGG